MLSVKFDNTPILFGPIILITVGQDQFSAVEESCIETDLIWQGFLSTKQDELVLKSDDLWSRWLHVLSSPPVKSRIVLPVMKSHHVSSLKIPIAVGYFILLTGFTALSGILIVDRGRL